MSFCVSTPLQPDTCSHLGKLNLDPSPLYLLEHLPLDRPTRTVPRMFDVPLHSLI